MQSTIIIKYNKKSVHLKARAIEKSALDYPNSEFQVEKRVELDGRRDEIEVQKLYRALEELCREREAYATVACATLARRADLRFSRPGRGFAPPFATLRKRHWKSLDVLAQLRRAEPLGAKDRGGGSRKLGD
ncbi:hypothetical protein KM043_001293 [Ampulex compressa]|nr:hypothetical protein KM043_001293 [Ampulex compressa]